MKIGDRLRAARRRAEWTQDDLAEAAGVGTETVSRIERGAFAPSLATACALARALGVSLDALFFEETPGPAARSPRRRG